MFPNFDENRKDDDLLDEIRQKINDQSNLNFEEKKNEINRSKNAFIGAVSGIALSAVVGWFALSPRYSTVSDVDIPVVRRPQTAIKVQPADPGGMEINNQDKTVYDIIDKKGTQAPVVENLLPPPEEPMLPELPAAVDADNGPILPPQPVVETAAVENEAEKVIAKAKAPVAVKDIEVEEKVISISQAAQNTPAAPKAVEQPKPQPQPTAETEPKRQPVNIKIEAPAAPAAVAQNTSSGSEAPKGSWQIQLMSSPNLSAVKNSWTSLSKKYNVLSSQPHEIETADLGAKGLFYRLKAGSFKDRAGADKLCNDIKALGGTCIVKKK